MSTYDNYENFELPARPLPQQKSNNKLLLILVIGLLSLVLVLASLLFLKNSQSDTATSAQSSTQTTTGANGQSNSQGQSTTGTDGVNNNTETQLPEVDPQIKTLIESQHRRELNDPMALGNPDAPLVIEMYADFRCGHCANFALTTEVQLKDLLEKGEIRYEFNNLPILGPESEAAARAAVAAGKQNKFWEYHHELFTWTAEGSGNYTEAGFLELATKVGISDLEKFKTDLNSSEIASQVTAELTNGRDTLGITGTPALLVGYSYIPGAVDFATLKEAIDAELARPAQ